MGVMPLKATSNKSNEQQKHYIYAQRIKADGDPRSPAMTTKMRQERERKFRGTRPLMGDATARRPTKMRQAKARIPS